MKRLPWLLLALLLVACQPPTAARVVHIVEGDKVYTLAADAPTLAAALAQAGLTLAPADELRLNGVRVPPDSPLPGSPDLILQICRATEVTLVTPDGQRTFQSTAETVGQALAETGVQLYTADFVDPPLGTPLQAGLTVTYRPARDLVVSVDGRQVTVKTSAQTVGQALAGAGLPLIGLDTSLPAESAPLPADGQVKIVRVAEAVVLQEKFLPFKVEYQLSAQLALDTQNLLQAGETGLAVSRVRIRTEDGVEVSRVTEAKTVLRPPKDRIVGLGTQAVLRPLAGTGLQYWRAVRMYATWYSPCHSGINGCSYGTASGLPVKKGVVAMVRRFYNAMAGQQVYVPGYGVATIGDVGGGMPDGRLWIDLAYSDSDTDQISGWVTVYFLAPVPASILYELQ